MKGYSFLLCPPTFFDVQYEINPWMHKEKNVASNLANKQWQKLVETYEKLGANVLTIDPINGLPDMVFTANAGLVVGDKKILLSKFRYRERQGEEKYFHKWFKDQGWEVLEIDLPFEGAGEGFFWKGKLLTSFGFRATREAIDLVQSKVGIEVVHLELIDPQFYHLDMALSPIESKDIIAFYPGAFSKESIRRIRSLDANLLEVSRKDAQAFGCNLVPNNEYIVMGKGTKNLARELKNKGLKIIELDMSEFKKAGGGVRCLTFELDF